MSMQIGKRDLAWIALTFVTLPITVPASIVAWPFVKLYQKVKDKKQGAKP